MTGLLSVRVAGARRVFERTFREYGLPQAIRTDNGVPFANTWLHGLTQLSVWWLRLEIQHQRICPANAPKQHHVGLEERDDGVWSLYLGPVLIGTIDERAMKVYGSRR